jgi:hypothetical protein
MIYSRADGSTKFQNTPEHIDVRFRLFTGKNPASEQLLKAGQHEAIKASHFDPLHITQFIIHGYPDTMKTGVRPFIFLPPREFFLLF